MSKPIKHSNLAVVDLSDQILVSTEISKENHAALRSGFAGCPANPRWSTSKFRAWKTGCKLREALAQGKIAVRSNDSMLVPTANQSKSAPSKNQQLSAKQLIAC